ncbi:MAG: flagellar export chaperone FliS [Planctomycetota bacterium]
MNHTAQASRSYLANTITNAHPGEIVVMMFDGALRFLRQARRAMEQNAVAAAGEALSRAQAMVAELMGSVDASVGGNLPHDLVRLYRFSMERMLTANLSRHPEELDAVTMILEKLRDGFDGAVKQVAGKR